MIAQVLKDEANKDLLFEDICKEKLVDICNGSLSSEVEVISPLDLAAVCGREEILQVESKKLKNCAKLGLQAVLAHGSNSPSRMEVYLRHNKLSHPAKVLFS